MGPQDIREFVNPFCYDRSDLDFNIGHNVTIRDINLANSPPMVNRSVILQDVEFFAPCPKRVHGELLDIITDDLVWYAEAAYNVFLHKIPNLLSCNGSERFSLYPFCEEVNGDDQEIDVLSSKGNEPTI